MENKNTHSKFIGYVLWLVGFMGAHRFYFGKPISGTIYFFTGGLLGIGWLVDLFLIPSLDRDAENKYKPGHIEYNLCWFFLAFLGVFGIHRLYLGKYGTGILYMFTAGLLGLGILYDYWTLNDQINFANSQYDSALGVATC